MARTPHRRSDRVSNLGGRHELGQNLFIDKRFPAVMTDLLRHAPPLPAVELGAGNGAVTAALVESGAAVTAVEIDPRTVGALHRRFGDRVEVVQADLLAFDYGPRPHHVVSNVPFGITTPLLRQLLPANHWHTAVLLLQWEVARKRAGIGGTTLLTAAWWPWYEFALAERVPAAAFRPVPAVDGGILVIRRRNQPLVDPSGQFAYQRLVREIFTGGGRGLGGILPPRITPAATRQWLDRRRLSGQTLPRDLTADDWASLYQLTRRRSGRSGSSGPRHGVGWPRER